MSIVKRNEHVWVKILIEGGLHPHSDNTPLTIFPPSQSIKDNYNIQLVLGSTSHQFMIGIKMIIED